MSARRRAAGGEHDHEPVRGLPGRLPPGETLLWQGAPDARSYARHGFHLGALAVYFAVLLAWCAARLLAAGGTAAALASELPQLVGLAAVALGLIALFAWAVGRTTVYTITDRRVVLRFGIAFPLTLNLPFGSVQQAGVRRFADGTGDLTLALSADTGMGWLILWPHVRPWRMRRAQPMLRAIPEVERVAQLLGRALATAAAQPAAMLPPLAETAPVGAGLPGAAAAA